jgi:4'-phosphopantetheinyl transferase
MHHDVTTGQGFVREIRQALAHANVVAPGAGEADALILDIAPWAGQATVLAPLLDAREQQRAARFHYQRDRERYILAHAFWRVVLGGCLDCEPEAVPLARSSSGQPQLPGTPLATSLSHSGDWVAVAVSGAVAVGIDIEQAPSRMALDDLATAICTLAEAMDIRQVPEPLREQALLQLWTRKEALLKAFGTGLLESPTALDVSASTRLAAPAELNLPTFRLQDLAVTEGGAAALAVPDGVSLCRSIIFRGHETCLTSHYGKLSTPRVR